jgi:FkbM family methyltransferase
MKAIQQVRNITRRFGFDVVRYGEPPLELELKRAFHAIDTIRSLAARHPDLEELRFIEFCAAHYANSKSQLFQDLFVQFSLREMVDGFFVEFGATNGVNLSNTHLLEKHFRWKGILAEPAKVWHEELRRNRDCELDFRCVWDKNGELLQFNQASDPELSTVEQHSKSDHHAEERTSGERYLVNTVSLNTLLAEHNAPDTIDYLSVDTEGSELQILSSFDFERFRVKVLTVEHNYTSHREKIHSLLASKGFIRRFEGLSLWDDWYVSAAT